MKLRHIISKDLKIAMHLMIYGIFFTQQRARRTSLPRTSNMSHGYILKSHYFVLICSNRISVPETSFNPVEFGWNSIDSVLLPNKCIVQLPEMYTVTCGCKKKCSARCQCSQFGASCAEFCKCIGEECCT